MHVLTLVFNTRQPRVFNANERATGGLVVLGSVSSGYKVVQPGGKIYYCCYIIISKDHNSVQTL